jgi:energy-coupling factor transporter ATP-binding protein EcfA2
LAHWAIDSMSVSGGFLSDLSLSLAPGLVCVIGPRGSGKSTLAEALRTALGGLPPGATKPRLDFIKATLGGAVLTVTTARSDDRAAMVVRRVVGQPANVGWADDRPITGVDLDRGTFLPLDAYSGAEIETIADESVGGRRKALLDDLCADEMQRIHLALADRRRELDANGDAITATRRRIADLTEQLEELGDAQSRVEALPNVPARAASPELDASSRQRLRNEQEKKAAERIATALTTVRERTASAVAAALADLARPVTEPDSPNDPVGRQVTAALIAARAELGRLAAEFERVVTGAAAETEPLLAELASCHAAQEAEHARLQQLNLQAAQAYEARTAAERALAAAVELRRAREAADAELARLHEARQTLKADYFLTRDRVSEARERVAAELQRNTGERVRIRVQRNADWLEYQERLSLGLKGSNLRNQSELLAKLVEVRPEVMAQILRDDDAAELETQTTLGRERCRKVLDALRQAEDPLKLEVVTTDDKVCIELNVSTGGEPHFKDAAELSRGQKCTALLPILLARRDAPLLIDQPEDNLDNHFIYETVVGAIRRLKPRRQMIFITHNANIPVLGGADLVVVMNSDGRRGYVQKTGSVDDCRDEIVDLLEGGAEAFELRRKRYGGK